MNRNTRTENRYIGKADAQPDSRFTNLDSRIHSSSLAFIQREIVDCHKSAQRALNHLDCLSMNEINIPELRALAHFATADAVSRLKHAYQKRAWEIKALT